jgi:hypothetical protein
MEAIIKEAGEFFEGRSPLHRAAGRLVERLDKLGIPFAMAGGFALGLHGYRRYTDVIDIVVRKDDWHRFKTEFLGLGYVEVFREARPFAIRRTRSRSSHSTRAVTREMGSPSRSRSPIRRTRASCGPANASRL